MDINTKSIAPNKASSYQWAPTPNCIELVKVKLKVKFTLEQATKGQMGSIGIALLFFNLGAGCEWVANATPRLLYPQ
jgi:hypothetical protein